MGKFLERRERVKTEEGEEVSVVSFIPEHRDKNFVKIFKLMSTRVLQDLKASGLNGATDVLWWFIDKLHLESDEIFAVPADIAKEIGCSEIKVYKHLRKLRDLKYIFQVRPRQHMYKVNAAFIFKGQLHKFTSQKVK